MDPCLAPGNLNIYMWEPEYIQGRVGMGLHAAGEARLKCEAALPYEKMLGSSSTSSSMILINSSVPSSAECAYPSWDCSGGSVVRAGSAIIRFVLWVSTEQGGVRTRQGLRNHLTECLVPHSVQLAFLT